MESNYEIYLKTNLDNYIGKWVAICDKGVVASGDNAKKVFEEAQSKFPNKKIMLVRVPDEKTMIF